VPIRRTAGHANVVYIDNQRMPAPQPFLPSVDGFAFVNSWPSQPAVELRTPLGLLRVGDAAAGLCGGMVFAALDHWHAGVVASASQPSREDPVYRYIVRRLVDSWHIPVGVAQYYQWMNLPDADTGFDAFGHRIIIERGLAWRTIRVQLPAVRADLDEGLPVPLGIVTVASTNPGDLALNHQVLAYRYDTDDDVVTLRVYDPNRGPSDDTSLRFTVSEPTKRTVFEHSLGLDRPVRGFFRTPYTPAAPPRST
jgi:hypothetical protein